MPDAEDAIEHAERSLDGALNGADLGLVGGARWHRLPRHLEETLWILKALEVVQATIDVFDAVESAGHVARGFGHEDLAGAGGGANASGEVDGAAEEIAALVDRLAGVDANAHRDPRTALRLGLFGDLPLDGGTAQDRPARGGERDHEAVALRLHDFS